MKLGKITVFYAVVFSQKKGSLTHFWDVIHFWKLFVPSTFLRMLKKVFLEKKFFLSVIYPLCELFIRTENRCVVLKSDSQPPKKLVLFASMKAL